MSMVGVKRGTQTFSKAPSSSPSVARDNGGGSAVGAGNISAGDFQKAYGDQNVGDVLNKVADPNYVDPAKKVRSVGSNELGKDAFLKLMLAQMKHQDPTNPMQSHEMAAQLAQFTSLEQLNNINTTLEAMKNQASPATNYQALALIGKKVSGDSSKIVRTTGDRMHNVNFEMMNDAEKVTITVKDSAGNVVRKIAQGAMKKGANSFEWNGLNEEGGAARPGEYKVSIEGVSSSGKKVFAKTTFGGRITGLNYTQEGPVLLVGNQSVKLSDVKKIEDAGPEDAIAPIPLGVGAGAGAKAAAGSPAPMAMGPKPASGPLPAQVQMKPESRELAKGANAQKILQQKALEKQAAPTSSAGSTPTMSQVPARTLMSEPVGASSSTEENIPAAEDAPVVQNNLESIGLPRELMQQIAKAK